MRRPRVLGVDLSLTSTGLARSDREPFAWTVPTKPDGIRRLIRIREEVLAAAEGADLAVLEGYSYGSKGRAIFDIGELGGVVKTALHEAGVRVSIVPPATMKIYATGKGGSGKDLVLANGVKRSGLILQSDEADALWLMAMGLDALGAPLFSLPQQHRRALDSGIWPVIDLREEVGAGA